MLSTVFGVLIVASFFITGGGAQPNSIRKIAEGVWFREGDMKQGHSNNAIIEMKDYLIVVDANFPSALDWPWPMPRSFRPSP